VALTCSAGDVFGCDAEDIVVGAMDFVAIDEDIGAASRVVAPEVRDEGVVLRDHGAAAKDYEPSDTLDASTPTVDGAAVVGEVSADAVDRAAAKDFQREARDDRATVADDRTRARDESRSPIHSTRTAKDGASP
jgi:hypothetical protein